jgi:hypothetical protein
MGLGVSQILNKYSDGRIDSAIALGLILETPPENRGLTGLLWTGWS